VRFEPLALSHEVDEARFYDSDSMSSSLAPGRSEHAASYPVPVSTLDIYTQQHGIDHIDLVKIDAEGFDLNVLEGASRLLDEQKIDIFLFEYADASKPYRFYRLFNGFLSPFTYNITAERFDLGCMFVGVSLQRLQKTHLPERKFPL
jgi:hypothetical protein